MGDIAKLLTVVIPCYNAESYMRRAVESALGGGDSVEILIIDDGSKDSTRMIADEYEERYSKIVRAIHQENKGHGGAIMTGLKNANGMYFKVVDADDWLDADAYPRLLFKLKTMDTPESQIDMFISNYVYDKANMKYKREIGYKSAMPEDRVFSWDEIGHFRKGQYILMHSVIYRTSLLRESGLDLPEHTFYVDSLYVYDPMPFVKRMYYMNAAVYHYFIGRDDQSVQENIMIKRIDQQLLVNHRLFSDVDLHYLKNKSMRRYLLNYLEIVTAISSVMLIISSTAENLRRKEKLWKDIKRKNPDTWRILRFRMIGIVLHLPGAWGRLVIKKIYKIYKNRYGFN
jgi:glycosyltransferase involved in cell wall biosynthesis